MNKNYNELMSMQKTLQSALRQAQDDNMNAQDHRLLAHKTNTTKNILKEIANE